MRRRALAGWGVVAAVIGTLLAFIPVNATAASTVDLCLYGSDGTSNTGLAMMPGTWPAIAAYSTGAEVAFQNASGQLETYTDANAAAINTGAGMDNASSPGIASNGSAVAIAYATASDQLGTYVNGSPGVQTGQAVDAGSTPGVALLSNNTFEYSFLDGSVGPAYGDGSSNASAYSQTDQGGAANSDVSIAGGSGGGWESTFKSNVNTLYTIDNTQTPDNSTAQNHTMGGQYAPIVGLSSGGYEIAFRAADTAPAENLLYLLGTDSLNTNQGMAPFSEPAITALSSSAGFEVAYDGTNGDLWLYTTSGATDTGQAMISGSTPAITQTSAGYEVAYPCAPAPAPAPTTTGAATTTSTTTTPVTSTTPTPTPPKPTKKKSPPHLIAHLAVKMTWDGHRSHIVTVAVTKKLPKDALITFRCEGTRKLRCPRLGTLPKRRRTLAKELKVVAGRTFARDTTLVITISAPSYATEVVSMRMPGDAKPRYRESWK